MVNQNSHGLESFKEYITKEIYWTDFEKKYKRDLAGKIGKPRSHNSKKYKNHRKNNKNYRENNKNKNKNENTNENKNEEFSVEKDEEDNDFDVIDNESNDEEDEKIINQFEMLETSEDQ